MAQNPIKQSLEPGVWAGDGGEGSDELSPLLHKNAFINRSSSSFFETLIDTTGSITNPLRRLSTDRNFHIVFSRPKRLLGKFQRICEWRNFYVDTANVDSKLRKYYEDQNYLIEKYTKIDEYLDEGNVHFNILDRYTEDSRTAKNPIDLDRDEQDRASQEITFIILVNFFINLLLLIGKGFIALFTNSITLIASLVDSVLDFLSTFIIYISNRLSSNGNNFKYPVGTSRLNPLSVLILAVVIITSFLQIIQESVKKFFHPQDIVIDKLSVYIMGLTILMKFACYLYCIKNNSTAINALAQDAKFDVIFNSFSILIPLLGIYADIWWLDPLGAIVLSVYIISEWAKISIEHINNLTGAKADELDYKVILYLCYRFSTSIKQITALKAYHVGDNLNVEIDLVFDDLSFKDGHDVAESLQYLLETLPNVERAFVHIDYMKGNYVGHLS